MAGNKYLEISSGRIQERAALQSSAGAGDAGALPALSATGYLSPTLMVDEDITGTWTFADWTTFGANTAPTNTVDIHGNITFTETTESVKKALSTAVFTNVDLSTVTSQYRMHYVEITTADSDSLAFGSTYGMYCAIRSNFDGVLSTNTGFAITSWSFASGTVTVGCTGHDFVAGEVIKISGITPTTLNGCVKVTAATAGVSFQFTTGSVVSPATYVSGGLCQKQDLTLDYQAVGARYFVAAPNAQPGGIIDTLVGSQNDIGSGAYSYIHSAEGVRNTVAQNVNNVNMGEAISSSNTVSFTTNSFKGHHIEYAYNSKNKVQIQNRVLMDTAYGTYNYIVRGDETTGGVSNSTRFGTTYGTYTYFNNCSSLGAWTAAYGSYIIFGGSNTTLPTTKIGYYVSGEAYNIFSGKVRIGDTAVPTEKLEIAGNVIATGRVTAAEFRLSNTAWDDLRFPAQSVNPAGAATPPSVETGTGFFLFDSGSTETVAGFAQMPHSWKEGTDIEAHIHWTPTSTNTGTVRWQLEYQVRNINEATGFDFSTGWTTITIDDAADGTTGKHQIADFSTITMTGKTLSCGIAWRVSRIGGNAADTYTADARLLEFDIHYEIDSLGSEEEYTKSA